MKGLNIKVNKGLNKRLNSKGITLIEIVAGIAIVGIILVTLIPLFTRAFINIKQSGDRTRAIYRNQSMIEAENAGTPTNKTLTVLALI